jgi:hypothetical protein
MGLDKDDLFEPADEMSFLAQINFVPIGLPPVGEGTGIAHLCRQSCARDWPDGGG